MEQADATANESAQPREHLPDDSGVGDATYHRYVAQAVERGVADANAGRVIPHDCVVAALRRKWLPV